MLLWKERERESKRFDQRQCGPDAFTGRLLLQIIALGPACRYVFEAGFM